MELKARAEGSVNVLELEGRFDAYAAPEVSTWVDQIISAPPANIVVNLDNVVFVDSTALATLVQGMKRCRQLDGDLRLTNLKQPVRMIFELTRLDRAFEIYNSEEEAVAAFTA